MPLIGKGAVAPPVAASDTWLWHVRSQQPLMNCARLRLNAETTTIFVRDGWLIVEARDVDGLREPLNSAAGTRLLKVAQVSQDAN
jgi:hypothetical protein